MTSPSDPNLTKPFEPATNDVVELTVGSVVDRRYLLKREIARGGMAIVFEAEHLVLGRRVALKGLSAAVGDLSWGRARLMREARALDMVSGPGIVRIFDAGYDSTAPHLVMELLDGRSLDSLLAVRGRLDASTACAVVQQLCASLRRVHARNVTHRDIKLANVIIAPDERGVESTHLIDFGIASFGTTPVGLPKLTRPGEQLGTFEYMAPEQLFAEPVTPQTDIYALGVVLYELISGEVPFPGGHEGVFRAHLEGKVRLSLGGHLGEQGRRFDRLLDRALAREPADRFPSVDDLADAIATEVGFTSLPLGLLRSRRGDSSPGLQDVRVHLRAPYVAPVRIVRASGAPVDGRTVDVSEGGLLVLTSGYLEHGERVNVRFSLPTSGRVVTLEARARWGRAGRQSAAVGLQFDSAPEAHLADIRSYVDLMREP